MKNPYIESLYRRMRQYHQHHPYPSRHIVTNARFQRRHSQPSSCMDDFEFILNGRRVEVYLDHPRDLYEEAIIELAFQQAGVPAKTSIDDDTFIKVYKRFGRSRKKVVSYTVTDSFFQERNDLDYRNRLNQLEDQYMAEGIDQAVSASLTIAPHNKGITMELWVPLEIRDQDDLLKLNLLVKRLLKRETTLQDEFPDYRYTQADWLQGVALRQLEVSEVIELSRADQIKFAEALLNPPEPNEALKRAATHHKKLIRTE